MALLEIQTVNKVTATIAAGSGVPGREILFGVENGAEAEVDIVIAVEIGALGIGDGMVLFVVRVVRISGHADVGVAPVGEEIVSIRIGRHSMAGGALGVFVIGGAAGPACY